MADLTPQQLDVLARTVLGEARGEGQLGMQAVAHNIRNRANSGQYPSDPAAVALQPYQYSTWNSGEGGNNPQQFSPNSPQYQTAQQIIQSVFGGASPDPTNGALFYHNPSVNPAWANSVNQYGTTQIGNHIFYNGRPQPTPVNPATQSQDMALMRNPIMSQSARNRQVTPYPQDQSLEMLMRRTPGETIATIPTSGIGQPPGTRVVQSVPMGGDGSAYAQAARRAALGANQSYVERNPGMNRTQSQQPSSQQVNDAARRAALTANQSYVERNPRAATPQEEQTEIGRLLGIYQHGGPTRTSMNALERLPQGTGLTPRDSILPLASNPIMVGSGANAPTPMPYGARPGGNVAPVPMAANMRPTGVLPIASAPLAGGVRGGAPVQAQLPIAANGGSGATRIVIDGAGSYSAPQAMTPVQQYQSMGLSPSQAYEVANQQAAANAYRNAYGKEDTRSDWFKSVTGG
jgi:N-acetylmuramoyl-L-alanine amidase